MLGLAQKSLKQGSLWYIDGNVASRVQASYNLYFKRYNLFLAQLLVVYMLSLLGLFGHFYISKYSKPAKAMKINTVANGSSKVGGNVLDGEISPDAGMKIKSG